MSQAQSPSSARVQSIQRAVAILRSFTEAEPELGVSALSRRLGLHKSTVSRILSTLHHEGLVSQNPKTGEYRLGLGLISLAGVALGRLDARGVAQPYLDTLVELSRETVDLTVQDGLECLTVDRAPSPQPIRYVGWIGRRTPLHCTASGKVFLAYMPSEARQQFLMLPLAGYTDKTQVDPEALELALHQISQQGYAVVHEEFEAGFSSIAAPVHDQTGQVVAAVSIAGPTYRVTSAQVSALIDPLKQVTHAISAELGYKRSRTEASPQQRE